MNWPTKEYDIVYIDPPWPYYGDPNKNAAAGKHYDLMSLEEIKSLDIKSILKKDAAIFCWATSPKMHMAVQAIESWGLHFRGVAHVWVKTRKDGGIIHGQGIRATYSKPTTEYLLLATTKKSGRPFKLLDEGLPQVVLEPRVSGKKSHSSKPEIFRQLIEKAYGKNLDKIEIFARKNTPGWDVWGNEVV